MLFIWSGWVKFHLSQRKNYFYNKAYRYNLTIHTFFDTPYISVIGILKDI